MQIPLMPMLSDEENNAHHISISFDGLTPCILNSSPVKTTIPGSCNKSITAVIDVKGLQRKNFDIALLNGLNIRRLWLLTNINDADDVFDVFNANIEGIMAPTHTVRSVEEMKDIFDISDSVIPVMFIRKGTCVCTGDNLRYQDALKMLTNIGFGTVATFDLDDSLTELDWKSLVKDSMVIPLSMSGKFSGDRFSDIGFEKYFMLYS